MEECQILTSFFFFFFDLHGRLDGEVQRVDELRSDSQVESAAIEFLVHLPGFWPVLASGLFQLWAILENVLGILVTCPTRTVGSVSNFEA